MSVDYVGIKVKAGDGGDGVVSFHREKYVEAGGPDGGDGGRGGDIIFVAVENMHTLLDFRFHRKFFAENGAKGEAARRTGKSGAHIEIKVPVGTIVRDANTKAVIADMCEKGVKRVLFKGGNGGAGNARFATPTRQAPNFSKPGERTKEFDLILELKTIADVGLVGFPNVGKSTLLSVVSAARPKIANYHFTTLEPNLGVVRVHDDGFVMADIPGIIEGASEGAGLGYTFLRHIERCRLLVHVIDMSGCEGRFPMDDFEIINSELKRYGTLSDKVQVVAANKMDLPDAQEFMEMFKEQYPDVKVFPISAATRQGIDEMLSYIMTQLKMLPPVEPFVEDFVMPENIPNNEPPFTITMDGEIFVVSGRVPQRLLDSTNFYNDESMAFFQRTLRSSGIIAALREMGDGLWGLDYEGEGSTIRIDDVEFDFVD